MYIIDKKLQERELQGNPIKVGVIGAGEMAKGLINQICRYTPGMQVVAVYNRTCSKAENALLKAGVDSFKVTDSEHVFCKLIDNGDTAITNQIDLLLNEPQIDVIVELTGHIEFGLKNIIKAFKKGKHVVSFNAELEATFGPYLKQKAQEHNVMYTLGDGDQPGVTQNLYRHVKMMGFEPLICGNIKGLQDHYRNPTTQQGFAKQWGMTPEMVTSFADGTKISFEQAVTANATNMCVTQRGMVGPNFKGHIDEMTTGFYPDIDKLKELGGIVDYVVGASPGPGVFIHATTEDPLSAKYLKYGKLGEGPLYSFYVPYHLLFFELAFSIARLIDFKDITLDAEFGMKVEVVAVAKENMKPGDRIDGLGGYKTYGICDNSSSARNDNLLPMGLAEACTIKKPLKKDELLTLDDVEFDNNILFDIYMNQLNTPN
ncbi:Gfo/Idh/MocA family oxidoreductase [Tamlana sp. 62-3]|uniref:Gfo/Idh/MocA family oxidoreductase n=1 Tax=Neotamlana sargassicola TaxID=2883125 RepID=A0A9X1I8G4_9FLAO|nr:Gfo/Idh/MocA family oxidoreductase [Tamlana sargassicola]MCB4809202.1 Gfo/Idh/MocA family oxidoreductase [Tamlana sargassicola]